jgi:hypothetical protein
MRKICRPLRVGAIVAPARPGTQILGCRYRGGAYAYFGSVRERDQSNNRGDESWTKPYGNWERRSGHADECRDRSRLQRHQRSLLTYALSVATASRKTLPAPASSSRLDRASASDLAGNEPNDNMFFRPAKLYRKRQSFRSPGCTRRCRPSPSESLIGLPLGAALTIASWGEMRVRPHRAPKPYPQTYAGYCHVPA